jgi:hypothetical protein
MENPVLIEVSLFDVRVSMAILLVHEVELLCQALTGWIPVRECLLLGALGRLLLLFVPPGIKSPYYSRISALGP